MRLLDEQSCTKVSGAYFLDIYFSGSVLIGNLENGDTVNINNLVFTDHGYFDLQGNKIYPYTVNGFKVINGYEITMYRMDQYDSESGSSWTTKGYRLNPI